MNDLPPMDLQSSSTPPPNTGTSALAIWSLVLGIVAIVVCLFCLGPLFAIPAVICGHLAMSRIKHSSGALAGNGMAIGGLVTGYLSIALSVLLIPIMASMALPAFAKAKQRAEQIVCINQLKMIESAANQWAMDHGKQSTDTPTWADLEPYLARSNMKTVPPVCPAGGTYTLHSVGEHPTCSIPDHKLPE